MADYTSNYTGEEIDEGVEKARELPGADTGELGQVLIKNAEGIIFGAVPAGLQGPQGPKGDKGDGGDQGIQGLQGIQGIQGPAGIPTIVISLADEATYSTEVSASGGAKGEVTVYVSGVATAYASFFVDDDGTLGLEEPYGYTTNISTADIDGYFCIVNDSGELKFINQLGFTAVAKYTIGT